MNVSHPGRLTRNERMEYIQNRMRTKPDINPTDLAQELDVSERTIYRDLRFLQKKIATKGRKQYFLENEMLLPAIQFTPSEAFALYSASANPALAIRALVCKSLRSALTKIGVSLSLKNSRSEKSVEISTEGLSVPAFTVALESIELPLRMKAQRAINEKNKIQISYWSVATDSEHCAVISPYNLREVHNKWVIVGHSETFGGIYSFPFARIRSMEILNDKFRIPRNIFTKGILDKAENAFQYDEELTLQIHFASDIANLIVESRGQQFSSMQTRPDGSLMCILKTSSMEDISWWLLSYGYKAEVVSPLPAREYFSRIIQRMDNIYSNSSSNKL